MIAKRIYEGATAADLDMPEISWEHRKAVLDRFLAQWNGHDFEESYWSWIKTQPEGQTNETHGVSEDTSATTKCSACGPPTIEASPQEMIRSASKAFKEFVVSGGELVAKRERDRRWAICQKCEYLSNGTRCAKCGCFMKIKTWLPAEICPIGKW